jgi:hypothetical protein
MIRNNTSQRGFTVVELMLAMTFLSFLLMFCIVATTQILKTYNKGLTIKQINQAGRTMAEEISRSARSAQSGRIQFNKAAGRLCLGDTAYVWNDMTPAMMGGSMTNTLNGSLTGLNIIRITDPSQSACTNLANKNFLTASPQLAVRITSNQVRLVDMEVEPNDKLIQFRFVLGSYSASDASLRPQFVGGQWQCANSFGGNFCAFAEFTTVAYLLNE